MSQRKSKVDSQQWKDGKAIERKEKGMEKNLGKWT